MQLANYFISVYCSPNIKQTNKNLVSTKSRRLQRQGQRKLVGKSSSWKRRNCLPFCTKKKKEKKIESLNASALGLELVVHVLNTGAIVLVGQRGEHSSSFPMSMHTHALGVQPWTWLKSVFTEGDILDPEQALKIWFSDSNMWRALCCKRVRGKARLMLNMINTQVISTSSAHLLNASLHQLLHPFTDWSYV